jgi:hypothetical protein
MTIKKMNNPVRNIESHDSSSHAKTPGRFSWGSDMKKLFITIFI